MFHLPLCRGGHELFLEILQIEWSGVGFSLLNINSSCFLGTYCVIFVIDKLNTNFS